MRSRSSIPRFVLLTAFLSLALLRAGGAEAASEATQSVFESFSNSIVQIRILEKESDTKAGIGSGFWVSPSGHIVTNFHVVSDAAYEPEKYRVEYLRGDHESAALRLVDVDIVHDLALLKADSLQGDALQLELEIPENGTRLYAFGNPYDLGLTIVDGIFNGFLEESLYEKIHFTGSLNPGMSGGPAVNSAGRVVGVNVQTAGNQVSFLVPAKYVQRLLKSAADSTDAPQSFDARIRKQLLDNQAHYVNALLATPFPRLQLGPYSLPGRLGNQFKCWGDKETPADQLYERVHYTCYTNDDIHVTDGQISGRVIYRHDLYRTEQLGSIRFFDLLEARFQNPQLTLSGDEKAATGYEFESAIVEQGEFDSKVVFCLRGYRRFSGLYDAYMTAVPLTSDDTAVQTSLALAGVSYENAVRFSQQFLRAIAWND